MLIVADARCLPLRDGCVQCVVTSPPYWGLRSYPDVRQIGLEATPEAYVSSLLAVFAEVWRVLKVDGTVFLNLGDSYNAYNGNRGKSTSFQSATEEACPSLPSGYGLVCKGLKNKDLVGIPWRVAFALQAAGWYLRSDIIWSKPNPMPESVTDRPTKAHEYIFLLSKSARYFYDAAAISESVAESHIERGQHPRGGAYVTGVEKGIRPTRTDERFNLDESPIITSASRALAIGGLSAGTNQINRGVNVVGAAPAGNIPSSVWRNKRSVWIVPIMPYAGEHFATFPEKLIEPCILAGCPVGGLVLDPFCGSGTVLAVAERFGRRAVGCDLSYQDLAKERTAQRGIRWPA